MKKKLPLLCNIISLLLVIAFAVKSIKDYSQYNATLNSAPFYVWLLTDAVFLLLPAILFFAVGLFIKKRK